jgi:hypothetical protein
MSKETMAVAYRNQALGQPDNMQYIGVGQQAAMGTGDVDLKPITTGWVKRRVDTELGIANTRQ